VQRRNGEVAEQLEARRVAARELLASAAPLQAQLEGAQAAAKAWVNRAPEAVAAI
jgi:ABC-type transporter Mla subunit MlaD